MALDARRAVPCHCCRKEIIKALRTTAIPRTNASNGLFGKFGTDRLDTRVTRPGTRGTVHQQKYIYRTVQYLYEYVRAYRYAPLAGPGRKDSTRPDSTHSPFECAKMPGTKNDRVRTSTSTSTRARTRTRTTTTLQQQQQQQHTTTCRYYSYSYTTTGIDVARRMKRRTMTSFGVRFEQLELGCLVVWLFIGLFLV